jgi:glycosyltransferase involved in cell wall biosynthesis
MRVCLVSHRQGGYDGVSVEAAKWRNGFEALGWPVTRAAGFFADRRRGDVVVRGMWADRPGGVPPVVDENTIERLCASHDLLVLDNAGSLASAPEASVTWERRAIAAGVPTIVRHHDPAWSDAGPRGSPSGVLPLRHAGHLHVTINASDRHTFGLRWPVLPAVGALELVHNRIDVDELIGGDRAGTRRSMGVAESDTLVVHPARVESAGKNIPGAVGFARALAARIGRPVRYWLTDDTETEQRTITDALAAAPGLLRGRVAGRADMYAAADVVVLPSTREGWGLPVVEAAAAGRLVVAGPYPVLAEIRALGLAVYDPGEVVRVAGLLADPRAAGPVLAANRAAVRRHFDIGELAGILAGLADRAARLAAA